ncbi:MAG: HK97 family phage prohead protease, partial [Rhodospirillaceae bacterium]
MRPCAQYAACWGGPADAAKDIMAPGALGKLTTMPAMLREHLPGVPVGQWTEVTPDEIGIRVSGVITDKTALADVRAGRLTGLSCGFHTLKSRPKGDGLRQIDLVDLKEISLAKNPVSSRARILTVKSATAAQGVTMDYETNTGAADEAALETKSMTDAIAEAVASAVAPIAARLDKFESVARRPGVGPALETKGAAIDREAHALAHFCRTGSDLEIKSASVSVDAAGGYSVLPQLDLTIRKVARDITP